MAIAIPFRIDENGMTEADRFHGSGPVSLSVGPESRRGLTISGGRSQPRMRYASQEDRTMSEQITLYALVDTTVRRQIHAICGTAEEADKVRRELYAMVASAPVSALCTTNLEIHAMNAAFPGDRYRLVYGRPVSMPSHPLEVQGFQGSRIPYTDAQSDAYLYPDELFVYRKEALAAAAKHNFRQLCRPGGFWIGPSWSRLGNRFGGVIARNASSGRAWAGRKRIW